MKRKWLTIMLVLGLFLLVTGCSKQNQEDHSQHAAAGSAKVIKVAVINTDKPKTFVDENGQLTGYDVEVIKAINAKLPEYQFQFEGMDQSAMLLGVESDKYAMASDGLFKNPDREKKFLFPEENHGLSLVKLVVKKDRNDINSLEDLTDKKLVPLPSNWGTYSIVKEYNAKNPDKQVKLETIDTLADADAYKWVNSGKYDAYLTPFEPFAEIQKSLNLNLKLSKAVAKVPTYIIFNKNQTELKNKVDQALKELKQDGTLSRLSEKWFGEDVFKE